jgi:hypothetical protein
MPTNAKVMLLAASLLLIPYAATGAEQTPPPPENPDPWAKLCDPGMKWEFEPLLAGKRTKKTGHEWPMIRIESADTREIAGVEVCRLKWSLLEDGKKPISFDGRGIQEHLRQGDERQPPWYEAQYGLDEARQIAVTPKGLVVVQKENGPKRTDVQLAVLIREQLSKDFVNFPGDGASAKQKADLEKTGRDQRRWGFTSGRQEIWCYGYKDDKCNADDTTCHQAACFVRNVGLVALYFGNGAQNFPTDFTFYSLVGFPEFESWRPMARPISK